MPDQADLLGCDGVDEGVALAGVLQKLARDGTTVDRVDDGAVACVAQVLAVELERARVHEARGYAGALERLDEAVEVAEHAAFLEVGDADGGVLDRVFVRAVDAHERLDPRVEQLELPDLVALREALEGLGLHERLADHEVTRHRAAAVGVELAELVAQVVLVQEEVETPHGEQLVVVAGQ